MIAKLKKKWIDWRALRAVESARKQIVAIEKAFMHASFDFLTIRGWRPTAKPGEWTITKPNGTHLFVSFREALQITLTNPGDYRFPGKK